MKRYIEQRRYQARKVDRDTTIKYDQIRECCEIKIDTARNGEKFRDIAINEEEINEKLRETERTSRDTIE